MGIPLSEFNKMTPKEFHIYLDGYSKRKELEIEEYKTKFELEQKQSIYQAYLISRWVWQKKIDIEKILNVKQEKKEMTEDQMIKQVMILNSLFGGDRIEVAETE